MKHLRSLSAIAVTILTSVAGAIAFLSLWSYFPTIGKLLVATFVILLGCFVFVAVTYAYNHALIIAARRRREELHSRVIVAGDVVALPRPDGTIVHLSALHEEAKRPIMLPPPLKVEKPTSEEETVLELHRTGTSFKNIAAATGWTEYQVRKLCNTYDGKPV